MPDWEEILARDGPAVWSIAFRVLGNRADADECFQDAFLAACDAERRGPVRHWSAFLRRVVTARAVDRLRRRLRQGTHEAVVDWDAVRGPDTAPSKPAEDAELSCRLREALAHLPAKQAEAFCLQVLEGWSYEEIAEHMEETTSAVGVLLHRARKQLRRLLSPPLEIHEPPHTGRETGGPPLAAEDSS